MQTWNICGNGDGGDSSGGGDSGSGINSAVGEAVAIASVFCCWRENVSV